MNRRSLFALALVFTGLALAACQRHSLYMDDDRKPSPSKTPDTDVAATSQGSSAPEKEHKP